MSELVSNNGSFNVLYLWFSSPHISVCDFSIILFSFRFFFPKRHWRPWSRESQKHGCLTVGGWFSTPQKWRLFGLFDFVWLNDLLWSWCHVSWHSWCRGWWWRGAEGQAFGCGCFLWQWPFVNFKIEFKTPLCHSPHFQSGWISLPLDQGILLSDKAF